MIAAKPPLPPKAKLRPEIAPKPKMVLSHVQWKVDEENIHQIQKLTAANEKLRIDVADIRKQLHFERNAVRELRFVYSKSKGLLIISLLIIEPHMMENIEN